MSLTHPPHGSPPLIEHERSYHHFVIALRYIVLTLATTVLFLLVCFGFGAGWIAGVAVAAPVAAVGAYFAYDRHPETP
jgi:hypothetical protein